MLFDHPNIWKMHLFRFLRGMHFFSAVLIPFFTDWGGLTYTQTLLLQSWFMVCIFSLEIPTGTIADHFGRKTSLAIGAVANIAGALAYSFIPNFYVFLFAEFLWALANALFSGADEALIYDSLLETGDEQRSKSVLGRYHSFGLVGIVVAAPIGSLIAATLGLRYTMLLMTVPFTFVFLISLLLHEPRQVHPDESTRFLTTLFSGVRKLKASKVLRLLAFDSIIIKSLAFMVIWTYQPLLLERGFPLAALGIVHAVIAGIQVPVLNGFTALERMTGSKKRYLIFSALIPGCAFLALGLVESLWLSIPLIVLIAALGLTRHVLFNNYMHKYIGSSGRATFMSTIGMLQRLTTALIYPVVGILMDVSLTTTVLAVGAVIVLISFLSGVEEVHLLD